METHSSTLAWKIPWTEEPGGLQSMGSQRFGYDWHTLDTHFLNLYVYDNILSETFASKEFDIFTKV